MNTKVIFNKQLYIVTDEIVFTDYKNIFVFHCAKNSLRSMSHLVFSYKHILKANITINKNVFSVSLNK